MPGVLYIVATPVGNLTDLSPRVKNTLEQVDLILAEDTRVSIKLLNHLGVKKRMISCHQFNERARLNLIKEFSDTEKNIALLSDAGTPLISDPGNEIVKQAIECDMKIVPIPGPSAVLLALVGSGLSCDRFVFEGFLPTKAKELKARLNTLSQEERTLVIYEAPHRLLKTLTAIYDHFGDRKIALARELTKLHEEFLRGTTLQLINQLQEKNIIGEFVIVLEGNIVAEGNKELQAKDEQRKQIIQDIEEMLGKGMSPKTIVGEITTQYKARRSEIYPLVLQMQKNNSPNDSI